MEPISKSTLTNGQSVKLYFNLHKKCLSVKDKRSGLIVAHLENVLIVNAKFKVSKKGRQRVIREKRKNVHAFIEGEIRLNTDLCMESIKDMGVAYYNPYVTETFIDIETKAPLFNSDMVYCRGKTIYYTKG